MQYPDTKIASYGKGPCSEDQGLFLSDLLAKVRDSPADHSFWLASPLLHSIRHKIGNFFLFLEARQLLLPPV